MLDDKIYIGSTCETLKKTSKKDLKSTGINVLISKMLMRYKLNELFLRQVLTERITELAVLADKYGHRVLKQAQ